jgi:ATP-dependent helicase/nuclease subunit A
MSLMPVRDAMNSCENPMNDAGASVWISASAGAGKTKSLVDRILALLLQGAEPSKILCLTHTNAGVAEMKQRLSVRRSQFCSLSEEDLAIQLKNLGLSSSHMAMAKSLREKNDPQWASIQTIHSFCFGLLQRFPMETGLLPGIKLWDDYQKRQMVKEAIDAIMADERFFDRWETVAKYETDMQSFFEDDSISKIQHAVAKVQDFSAFYGDFFNQDRDYLEIDNSELNRRLFSQVFGDQPSRLFPKFADILDTGGVKDREKAQILRENTVDITEKFLGAFLTKDGKILAKLCSKAIEDQDFCRDLADMARKAEKFHELRKNHASARANAAFFTLMREIIRKVAELKTVAHRLAYDDIISSAATLLENVDWALYKIDGGLDHILVDEAQDASRSQWEIIKRISGEFFSNSQSGRTIFVVGDKKQSIYSFHGADVKSFDVMREHFRKRATDGGQKFHDLQLHSSYRTTGNILSFVDDVFADAFGGEKHLSNRAENSGVVEVVDIFEDDVDRQEADNPNAGDARKKLADYVANFIGGAIEKRVLVESRGRGARPADFLILFRRRNLATMKSIVNALKNMGIPSSGLDRIFLKEELIVEDLMAFAEFALFQRDDLMCARCLKSPLVGMTENDLMRCCLDRGDEKLWEYLQKNDQMYRKYSLDRLQNHIEGAVRLSASDFFMRMLMDGGREKFIRRLGSQCLEALHEFLQTATYYENENNPGLQSFVAWFRSFDHEIKRIPDNSRDAVRLMTVHGAKGLQAPFVLLADCDYHRSNREKTILETADGVLLWDFSRDFRGEELQRLRENDSCASLEESQRLLYVAMTRAEDFLLVLGAKHREKSPNKRTDEPSSDGNSEGDEPSEDGEESANGLHEKCWYSIVKNRLNKKKFTEVIEFKRPSSSDAFSAGTMRSTDAPVVAQNRDSQRHCASVVHEDLSGGSDEVNCEKDALGAGLFSVKSMRCGEYKYVSEAEDEKSVSSEDIEIPIWFQEKLETPPERKVNDILKTPQIIYGDCVHFLLTKMPLYKNHHLFQEIIDDLLEHFPLSQELKNAAKSEAYAVMTKFDFLFSSDSRAEVSFVHGGVEGRIDRMAPVNGEIWIVDFKTGTPYAEAPLAYVSQLRTYKDAVTHILRKDRPTVRIAILWTQSLHLAEIFP